MLFLFFPESIERIIPQPYPAPAYHSTAAEVVECSNTKLTRTPGGDLAEASADEIAVLQAVLHSLERGEAARLLDEELENSGWERTVRNLILARANRIRHNARWGHSRQHRFTHAMKGGLG